MSLLAGREQVVEEEELKTTVQVDREEIYLQSRSSIPPLGYVYV
jgi:hypothetical protein